MMRGVLRACVSFVWFILLSASAFAHAEMRDCLDRARPTMERWPWILALSPRRACSATDVDSGSANAGATTSVPSTESKHE